MRDISTRSYQYEIPVLARILIDRTEEFYCGVKDFWRERSLLMKSYTFVETLPGFVSGSFSSCLYFHSRKESEYGWSDKGKSHLVTSGGKSSKRVWTNALLAINVIAYIATDMSWGAKINSLEGGLWRLVTSSFLHADTAHFLVGSFAMFCLRHGDLVPGAKDKMPKVACVLALNMVYGLLSNYIGNWGNLGGLLGGATISLFVGWKRWKH